MNMRGLSLIAVLAFLTGLAFSQNENGFDIVSLADTSVVIGSASVNNMQEGGTELQFSIGPNEVIAPGEHAIHIHENGSCEPADTDGDGTEEPGGAAGGHFNPTDMGHGEDNGPHAGDSEEYNYIFGDDGSFTGDVRFPEALLSPADPLLTEGGLAVVIHAGVDDMSTDPAGNSGEPVACGVIMITN